jgi:hypothetical protein
LTFLRIIKPAVKVAHVQDEATQAKHMEAFAALGVTLRLSDDVKAEKAENAKPKPAVTITPASAESLAETPAETPVENAA